MSLAGGQAFRRLQLSTAENIHELNHFPFKQLARLTFQKSRSSKKLHSNFWPINSMCQDSGFFQSSKNVSRFVGKSIRLIIYDITFTNTNPVIQPIRGNYNIGDEIDWNRMGHCSMIVGPSTPLTQRCLEVRNELLWFEVASLCNKIKRPLLVTQFKESRVEYVFGQVNYHKICYSCS